MLDQIEQAINNLPSISFEEFYTSYVENVQDDIIRTEAQHFSSYVQGARSIAKAEKSIQRLVEGMVSSK